MDFGSRLASDQEVCVDPREVVAGLPGWLSGRFGVDFDFGRTDHGRRDAGCHSPADATWSAQRLWICSGDELNLLFADEFVRCGLVRCKLQMMRSDPQGGGWRIGPMLAAGLTLRHYRLVSELPEPCRRFAAGSPRKPPGWTVQEFMCWYLKTAVGN